MATQLTHVASMRKSLNLVIKLVKLRIETYEAEVASNLAAQRWSVLPGYQGIVDGLKEGQTLLEKALADCGKRPRATVTELGERLLARVGQHDRARTQAAAERRWADAVTEDAGATACVILLRILQEETATNPRMYLLAA